MDSKLRAEIRFEIEQVDRLFETYAGLLEKVRGQTPDIVEITAIASVLHSFYNGLENIFLSIAKRIDKDVPTGTQWHRDLLNNMIQSTSNRVAVPSDELSL